MGVRYDSEREFTKNKSKGSSDKKKTRSANLICLKVILFVRHGLPVHFGEKSVPVNMSSLIKLLAFSFTGKRINKSIYALFVWIVFVCVLLYVNMQ